MLAVAAFLIGPIKSNAQYAFNRTAANPTGVYVDTGSDTATLRLPGATAVQYVVVRNSGTLAGKSYLYGSLNGTDFAMLDSATHTNVARSTKIWQAGANKYVAFRIISVGSGTMNATTRHVAIKL